MKFSDEISSHEEIGKLIIGKYQKMIRGENKSLITLAMSQLFILLEFLSQIEDKFTIMVYKTLTFAIVENLQNNFLREYLIRNMIDIFKLNILSIGILLDPYLTTMKNIDTIIFPFNIFDFDFINLIINDPKLNIKNASDLIEFLVNLFYNNIVWGNLAVHLFKKLINRFQDHNLEEL